MQPTTQNSGAASQVGNMSSGQFTDPRQTIEVEEAVYRGRGAYSICLKNIGNRGIGAKQLTLRPFYHVKNKPVVVGATATNLTGIVANGRALVSNDGGGIFASGMAECGLLEKVVIEIKNPLTGQLLEHPILVQRPQGKIVDVDMYLSNLTYTVKNTGPYRSKFRIRMLSITLYKGKHDRISALKDLFHTTITLDPGEVGTVSVPSERVNAELKAKYPALKKKFYGADHYQAELYTECEANYCRFSQPLVLDQANFNRDIMGAGEEILVSE
ncbi:MAG: hypothetical protein JXA41_04665 [Deltaproteobacteria bacterium]|nr:hypothetical protein [Deltaproteobacteria bacterium]